MQWKNGVHSAGFGFHPDEPAHYVTGLMVYKYLTTGVGTAPLPFAERFYAHYPAVAFGHWPPLFYVMQAAWCLAFGASRSSVLILIAALSGIISVILCLEISKKYGRFYGVTFAVLFLLLPIVQQHTGSIMAEVPLTLFTLGAVLLFASFMAAPEKNCAFAFAALLAAASLTKGDGWCMLALPITVFLVSRTHRSMNWKPMLLPLFCFLACCVPITLSTLQMTRDGWDQQSPSLPFFTHAFPTLAGFYLTILGAPLLVLACLGIITTVREWFAARKQVENIDLCNVAVVIIVLVFHAVVPTSLEARKLFMAIPSLLMLASCGLSSIMNWIPFPQRYPALRNALPVMLGVAAGTGFCSRPAFPPHANMSSAARSILSQAGLRRSVLLVASGQRDEREELSFVAEVAEQESGNFQHAVVRGGKLLADSSWLGSNYRLVHTDPEEVRETLAAIPISVIVLYKSNSHAPTLHYGVLERMLDVDANAWQSTQYAAPEGSVELFRSVCHSGKPVQLPVINLSRKLGRNISSIF